MSLSEQNRFQSLDIAYSSAQDKLKFQSEQWNAVDQKNSVVLAVYGIIMAVFLAGGIKTAFIIYRKTIIGIWLLSIVSGMVCSLISLRPKVLDMPPKIDTIIDKYLHGDIDDTKKNLLSSMIESIKKNNDVIKRKSLLLSCSINSLLPISLGITAIAIFLNAFMKG